MIKDKEKLTKVLLDYLQQQIVVGKKKSIVIHFDGTLMSLVNALLAKKLENLVEVIYLAPIVNETKYMTGHIGHLASKLGLKLEFLDLAKDFEKIGFHTLKDQSTKAQIAYKKRFTDLALSIAADQKDGLRVSNLCYSQWIVGFPNINYQSHEQVNLLYRLFYDELKELAYYLGLSEELVEREPSFYLWSGQIDRDLLGFNYKELEDFLRSQGSVKSEEYLQIGRRLIADNRNQFLGPLIQRPSNLLA